MTKWPKFIATFAFLFLFSVPLYAMNKRCKRAYDQYIQRCKRKYLAPKSQCLVAKKQSKKRCRLRQKTSFVRCSRLHKDSLTQCPKQLLNSSAKDDCRSEKQTSAGKCGSLNSAKAPCRKTSDVCRKTCKGGNILPCLLQCRDGEVRCSRGKEDIHHICMKKSYLVEENCLRKKADSSIKSIFACRLRASQKKLLCERGIRDQIFQCQYESYKKYKSCLRSVWDRRRKCFSKALEAFRVCK